MKTKKFSLSADNLAPALAYLNRKLTLQPEWFGFTKNSQLKAAKAHFRECVKTGTHQAVGEFCDQ
jgi:hypothetical protein